MCLKVYLSPSYITVWDAEMNIILTGSTEIHKKLARLMLEKATDSGLCVEVVSDLHDILKYQ